ncbi:MAG: GGDEF domain-containing response regulator [Acidiferrobacteraceae bacterium]
MSASLVSTEPQKKVLRILVIDSSRVSRKVISRALANEIDAAGVDITAVGTAQEAVQVLKHLRFDLITCSILLPDMYGIELCKMIRKTDAHRFTPFIVVTAEPHARLMREGFSAGVTDYYNKTQGFKDFVHFIRGFAERHAGLVGKVLYLEDSDADAEVTRSIMERHGLEVVRVVSAEQALKVVDGGFDLIVADFFLKDDLSGGDFLHTIRCGLRYSREELPVLMMTANEDRTMQAEIFHAGGNDFVTKPVMEEILISRIRSLLLIKQQFHQLRRQSEELSRKATTDSLTGTHNKRYLMERAASALSDLDTYPAWLALIDLDHFKQINDQHGHLVGDQVLEGLGALLNRVARKGDIIARIGGEEFALLLMSRTGSQCRSEMEQLRAAIEHLKPASVTVTASIGVATNFNRADAGFTDLFSEADEVLYEAKRAGRNRVVFYGASLAKKPREGGGG